MTERIYVKEFEKYVEWPNDDYTIVIGESGGGKTLFLNAIMDWCEVRGYTFAHSHTDLILLSQSLIKEASDMDLYFVSAILAKFSHDFASDIAVWAEMEYSYDSSQKDEYMKDRAVLETVLSKCGAGYTRMFCMLLQGVQNPSAEYFLMDLPETSLHIHIQRQLIKLLMSVFSTMKFVVATHSPEIIESVSNVGYVEEDTNIIELPEMFVD